MGHNHRSQGLKFKVIGQGQKSRSVCPLRRARSINWCCSSRLPCNVISC